MIDYHFRHYTLSVEAGKTCRLYNWVTMRPEHLSPVIMAILTPLIEARGDAVSLDALISSAKGARRVAGLGRRPGRPGGRSRQGGQAASLCALRQAASRLRRFLGAKGVLAVTGRGYRTGFTVRVGAR